MYTTVYPCDLRLSQTKIIKSCTSMGYLQALQSNNQFPIYVYAYTPIRTGASTPYMMKCMDWESP